MKDIGMNAKEIIQYSAEQLETPIIEEDFLLPLRRVNIVAIAMDRTI